MRVIERGPSNQTPTLCCETMSSKKTTPLYLGFNPRSTYAYICHASCSSRKRVPSCTLQPYTKRKWCILFGLYHNMRSVHRSHTVYTWTDHVVCMQNKRNRCAADCTSAVPLDLVRKGEKTVPSYVFTHTRKKKKSTVMG